MRWEWNAKETKTAKEKATNAGDISIVMDSSLISRGERLSHTLHDTYCHGESLKDSETSEMVGSNLTKSRPRYSNADLVKVIRFGIKNDDLPATVGDKSENSFIQEILARIVEGYRHVGHGWTPVYDVTFTPRRSALPSDGPIAYGKYLTQTHCARCHSEDLPGDPGYWQTPDVAVDAGTHQGNLKNYCGKERPLEIGILAL